MPIVSEPDKLNFLYFQAETAFKDQLLSNPGTGDIARAIEIQHIGLSAEPALSNTALFGGNTIHSRWFLVRAIGQAFDSAIGRPIVRQSLQNTPEAIFAAKLRTNPPESLPPVPPAAPFTPKPGVFQSVSRLPDIPPGSPGSMPDSGLSLRRDMRTTVNPRFIPK